MWLEGKLQKDLAPNIYAIAKLKKKDQFMTRRGMTTGL
jgi:hypothetical protein